MHVLREAFLGREPPADSAGARQGTACSVPGRLSVLPAPGEASVPELEEDENLPPRPEEGVADELRAVVADHAQHPA